MFTIHSTSTLTFIIENIVELLRLWSLPEIYHQYSPLILQSTLIFRLDSVICQPLVHCSSKWLYKMSITLESFHISVFLMQKDFIVFLTVPLPDWGSLSYHVNPQYPLSCQKLVRLCWLVQVLGGALLCAKKCQPNIITGLSYPMNVLSTWSLLPIPVHWSKHARVWVTKPHYIWQSHNTGLLCAMWKSFCKNKKSQINFI